MLKLDKRFIKYLKENNIKKLKFFFYKAGCSGIKLDVIFDDFLETQDLALILSFGDRKQYKFDVYVKEEEKKYFENANISRIIKSDHTGKEKVRYIFINEKIQDRCGCGSSFSFEKKVPKIDLEKLKNLKHNFKIGR